MPDSNADLTEFAAALRTLRESAGKPSFRDMAKRSGCISHTTLHEAAKGRRMPSWQTTLEYVRACGGDPQLWQAEWEKASGDRVGGDVEQAPTDQVAEPSSGHGQTPSDNGSDTPDNESDSAVPRKSRPGLGVWPRRLVAAAVGLLLVGGGVVLGRMTVRAADSTASNEGSASAAAPEDLVAGVEDLTIPDGTSIPRGSTFVKSWRITNGGSIVWHERYLARVTPQGAVGAACVTPDKVEIGDTHPGEAATVTITVVAPAEPGECKVDWKITDATGAPVYPDNRAMYFQVVIT